VSLKYFRDGRGGERLGLEFFDNGKIISFASFRDVPCPWSPLRADHILTGDISEFSSGGWPREFRTWDSRSKSFWEKFCETARNSKIVVGGRYPIVALGCEADLAILRMML